MLRSILGVELEAHNVLVTVDGIHHEIDHLDPYPGHVFDVHGDCAHARIAHAVDGTMYTISDHGNWNIDVEEPWNTKLEVIGVQPEMVATVDPAIV